MNVKSRAVLQAEADLRAGIIRPKPQPQITPPKQEVPVSSLADRLVPGLDEQLDALDRRAEQEFNTGEATDDV